MIRSRRGAGERARICTGSGGASKASGAPIEAMAMDMSPAHARTMARYLPSALIGLNRFHVMKLMNE